jgi:hypothetical protein
MAIRADLYAVEKRKISFPCEELNPNSLPTQPTAYPGSYTAM